MPTFYEFGFMVAAAVGAGGLASVATRLIRRAEIATVLMLILSTALAAVVTVLIMLRTVLA